MNKNQQQIENFLKYMRESARMGININPDMIYSNLNRYNGQLVDRIPIANNFTNWIDRFEKVRNINVFVSPVWKYFCQFTNDSYNESDLSKMIKIYVPVDKGHVYEYANAIFDFMANNNIHHHSKIGSHQRIDDIVIRVYNRGDAEKVEEFINNNAMLKEGIMDGSPFAFHSGKITYAWDDNYSYNFTVATYISEYINKRKKEHKLDDVSCEDFKAYLKDTYNNVFVEGKNLKEFADKMEIEEMNAVNLANHEGIIKMLLAATSNNSKEEYYSVYDEITDPKYQGEMTTKMDKLINQNPTYSYKPYAEEVKAVVSQQMIQEFAEKYMIMVRKYGYYEADNYIMEYIRCGNVCLFTREGGVRSFIVSNNITSEMVALLFVSIPHKDEKIEILENATYDTLKKYDLDQAVSALHAAKSGEFGYFTNDNGGRKTMKQYVGYDESYGLIMGAFLKHGYSIDDIPVNEAQLYQKYFELLSIDKEKSYVR